MVGIKKILIAVEEEMSGKTISTFGLKMAKQLNAKVALISVIDTVALMSADGISPYEMVELSVEDIKQSQQVLLDKVFKEEPVKVFVERGNPFDEIVRTAEEWKADLIVIGTHGRKGFSHLFIGSVAEKVVRHSPVPVLVVPLKNE